MVSSDQAIFRSTSVWSELQWVNLKGLLSEMETHNTHISHFAANQYFMINEEKEKYCGNRKLS